MNIKTLSRYAAAAATTAAAEMLVALK